MEDIANSQEPDVDEVYQKLSCTFGSSNPPMEDLVLCVDLYEKYFKFHQEKPKLLFNQLDTMFQTINELLEKQTSMKSVKALYQLINIAYSTVGLKQMIMHIPHELQDFCLYMGIIEKFAVIDMIKSSKATCENDRDFNEVGVSFSVISGILLQLCASITLPFCLETVYAGSGEVISSLINALLDSNMQNSVCFDIIPYLFAIYYRRSDIKSVHFNELLSSIVSLLNGNLQYIQLHCLTCYFKVPTSRDMDRAMYTFQNLSFEKVQSPRIQKMVFKLIYRLALCFLCNETKRKRYRESPIKNLNSCSRVPEVQLTDDNSAISKEVEECIVTLFNGLASKTAEARYTSSKGLARIMEKLSDNVISQLLSNVNKRYKESSGIEFKQGICLLYGEMARRGLICPSELPEILIILKDAVVLENRQVSARDGTYVRDAACYVFWAFSRAFLPKDYGKYALELTAHIINTAAFDRESVCRRAASAALQECVGRTGVVPFGIELTVILDFVNISSLSRCLTQLVPEIYKITEYQDSIMDHLMSHCLGHWDVDYRLLATKAILNCAKSNPAHFFKSSIRKLFQLDILSSPAKIHGYVLSLAKVLRSCSQEVFQVCSAEMFSELLETIDSVKKKKTTSATLLMSAKIPLLGSFIEADLGSENLKYSVKTIDSNLKEIHDCHIKRDSRLLSAVEDFFSVAGRRSCSVPEYMDIFRRYVKEFYIKALHDFRRITVSLLRVSAYIPITILKENFEKLSFALFDCEFMSNYDARKDLIYNDILAESISIYGRVLFRLLKEDYFRDSAMLVKFYDRLIDLAEFYQLSSSGEIGCCVRSTSLKCLYKLIKVLVKHTNYGGDVAIERCWGHFIRQSSERNQSLRCCARKYFCKLLLLKGFVGNEPCFSSFSYINDVICNINRDEWNTNVSSFSINIEMLGTKFCKWAMLGIMCYLTSCDNVVSNTPEAAALISMINDKLKCVPFCERICSCLIDLLDVDAGDKRTAIAVYVCLTCLYKLENFILHGVNLDEIVLKTLSFLDNVRPLMTSVGRLEQRIDILINCMNLKVSDSILRECAISVAKLLNHAYFDVRKCAASKLLPFVTTEQRIVKLLDNNVEMLHKFLVETDWENDADADEYFVKILKEDTK